MVNEVHELDHPVISGQAPNVVLGGHEVGPTCGTTDIDSRHRCGDGQTDATVEVVPMLGGRGVHLLDAGVAERMVAGEHTR